MGFHGQKFTSAVKNHLHKTRPSRVLVPPAAKQRLPPAPPQPVIELDPAVDQEAADRPIRQQTPPPGRGSGQLPPQQTLDLGSLLRAFTQEPKSAPQQVTPVPSSGDDLSSRKLTFGSPVKTRAANIIEAVNSVAKRAATLHP